VIARSWRCSTEAETLRAGEEIARALDCRGVVLLHGDLGAGKTVVVKGMARALGIPVERIQSPTFTLVAEHQGEGGRLAHLDLYRLEPLEVEGLGIDEVLAGPGLAAVEWAERLPWSWPAATRVTILVEPSGARVIEANAGMG
jgi:tRNA threonylcarbamoyladenosine biosynthesis protein TsaE